MIDARTTQTPRLEVILTDFRSVQLVPAVAQVKSLEYLAWLMSGIIAKKDDIRSEDEKSALFDSLREKISRYGAKPDTIAYRQINNISISLLTEEISDRFEYPRFNKTSTATHRERGLEDRMNYYGEIADDCFSRLYDKEEDAPDDIIHVSCSGYLLPSPAQKLVASKRWFSTNVTHSYHMGCYGAFPAVHIAAGQLASSYCLLAKPRQRVDIVHTELLSIHANLADDSPGNIVNLTLFGDGFVKYSACPLIDGASRTKRGMRILAAETAIIADSLADMTWRPGSHRFDMYLSSRVPRIIRNEISPLLIRLCYQRGVDFEQDGENLLYAIHPGGPQILKQVAQVLGVEDSKMRWSWEVLRHCGNMSSATIPHVWMAMLDDPEVPVGQMIVSVAFGPGLTATGMLLEKVG